MKLAERRIASSSSTRCTTWFLSGMAVRLDYREVKRGAAKGRRLGPDPAAVAEDDGVADRQAQPHTGGLGADERLEQMLGDFPGDAGAAVLDRHADMPVGAAARADPQAADGALRYRLDGVADEVDQHLLDLDPVDQYHVGQRIEPDLDLDPAFARSDQRQRARLADDAAGAGCIEHGLA